MRISTCGGTLVVLGAALLLSACGGGSGGGNAPVGGASVMLDVPVKWFDANSDGFPNVGDELRIEFDRSVEMGANAPSADLAVVNGSLGTSTWANGPGNNMTIVLAGPINLASIGKVIPAMTIALNVGNTLANPVDATTPAIPSAAPQTIMGTVTDSGQTLGTGTAWAVALQRVNNQALPDIVIGFTGPNRAYFNDGTGVFTPSLPFVGEPIGGRDTRAVTLLDENGDGKADFLVTGNSGANAGVRANLVYVIGLGAAPLFTHVPDVAPFSRRALGTGETRGIGSADFDGDGNLDVVCGNLGQSDMVYFGDGLGNFNGDGTMLGIKNPVPFGGTASTRGLAVGKIAAANPQGIVTVEGDESGRLMPWQVPGSGNPVLGTKRTGLGDVQCVALCDLDNDADLDAIVGLGSGGGIKLFENNGTGTFTAVGVVIGTDSVFSLTCVDVDGDAFMDIVAGNANGAANKIWLNCAAFAFADSQIAMGSFSTMGIASSTNGGGVDAAGHDDIATANAGGGNKVYLVGK